MLRGSLRPSYCACHHKLRCVGWNSQFGRLIHELNAEQVQSTLLRQIEKFIRFDAFIARNKDSELIAAQALLTLWAKLLQAVNGWWKFHVQQSQLSPISSQRHSISRQTIGNHSHASHGLGTLEADQPLPPLSALNLNDLQHLTNDEYSHHAAHHAHQNSMDGFGAGVRTADLKLIFQLLDMLINRHEFDLIHLLPPNTQQTSPPCNTTASLASAARIGRAQSVTVPQHQHPRFASSMIEQPLHVGVTGHQHSSTVPGSSSSFNLSLTSRHQPVHPSWLSHSEQLGLFQNYRQLLQSTVLLILKIVRESAEGKAELSSLSSNTSQMSGASSSSGGHACVNNDWDTIDPMPVTVASPTMLQQQNSSMHDIKSHDREHTDAISPSRADPDHSKYGNADNVNASGELIKSLAVEKEAALERHKVEEMRPELTVAIPPTTGILPAILPVVAPLSPPITVSSPHIPLSPVSSTASPSSTSRLFSAFIPSHNAPSVFTRSDFVWFTGRLLAVAFFRLPVLSGPLLDALSSSASMEGPSQRGSPYLQQRTATAEDQWRRAMLASVDEFIRSQSLNSLKKSTSISSLVSVLTKAASAAAATTVTTPSSAVDDDEDNSLIRSATTPIITANMLLVQSTKPASAASSVPTLSLPSTNQAARQQRALTAAFIAVNPSFFEWTKPELNRDTHPSVFDCSEADDSSNGTSFRRMSTSESEASTHYDNSSFHSDASDDDMLTAHNLACVRLLLGHSVTFFVFAAAWLSHVHRTANPVHPNSTNHHHHTTHKGGLPPFASPERRERENQAVSATSSPTHLSLSLDPHSDGILWDCVPGYRELLHTFMKRLIAQSIVTHQHDDEDDDDLEGGMPELDALPIDLSTTVYLVEERKAAKLLKAEESIIATVKRETIAETETFLLRNSAIRAQCLSWLVELTLRHASVTDKRGVEKSLETLDTWFNLFLVDAHAARRQTLLIASDMNFSSASLPAVRLSPRMLAQLGPLTPNTSLPWLTSVTTAPLLFMAQQRERCQRSRFLAKHTVNNPAMAYPFPSEFCDSLLTFALTLLLQQEHFQLLLKTLTFIYMHTGHFDSASRQELFDALLAPAMFPRLFLHWCAEIRRVFHCLLLYRLSRDGRMPSFVPGGEPANPTVTSKTVLVDGKEQVVQVINAAPTTSIKSPPSSEHFEVKPQHSPASPSVESISLAVSLPPLLPASPNVIRPRKLSNPNTAVNDNRPSALTIAASPTNTSAPNSAQLDSVRWWTRLSSSLWSLIDPSFAIGSDDAPLNTAPVHAATLSSLPLPMSRSVSDTSEPRGHSKSFPSGHHRPTPLHSHLNVYSDDERAHLQHSHGHEPVDPLRSIDPALDTCAIVRTVMDRDAQETDAQLFHTLDTCLMALHHQYYLKWPTGTQQATNKQSNLSALLRPIRTNGKSPCGRASPSLKSPTMPPPHSDVLIYQPHLRVYAVSAFKEFRALLASFRRVQSQLSPSLCVPHTVHENCLLPSHRQRTEGGGKVRVVTLDEQTTHRGAERGRRSSTGSATNCAGSSALALSVSPSGRHRRSHEAPNAPEGESAAESLALHGYEGCVLVPQLYYSLPH